MTQIQMFSGRPGTPAGFPIDKVNDWLRKYDKYNPKLHFVPLEDSLIVLIEYTPPESGEESV